MIAAGGGAAFPHTECFIIDALTQGPVFDSVTPQDGNSGPMNNVWGDYYGLWTHPVATRTWIASTMALRGGPNNANQTPRFVWFGRPQYQSQWVTLAVNSTPAVGVPITMAQTDLDGNKDGPTNFARRLAPLQGYTLLAPLQHVSAQGILVFDRWAVNGAPQPVDQLLLDVSSIGFQNQTAEARYVPVRALAVGSTNPAAGVPITVDTIDITGSRDGLTGFTRFYKNLAVVGLTAPATMGINPFRRWRLNGTAQPDNQRTVPVGLVQDVFALAEYWDHVLGSFTPFGSGCSYSNGQDVLTASGTPETAQTAIYRLAGGRGQSVAFLMIGFDNTRWTTIPLPLPLAPFAPGCTLYNGMDGILSATTNAAGACSINVPIPNDVNLIGGHYYCQYWCVDPGANAVNLSFSNGMDTMAGGLR